VSVPTVREACFSEAVALAFYKPFHFTHQSASWVSFAAEDVRYPDGGQEL
jgi:hypothetical protein